MSPTTQSPTPSAPPDPDDQIGASAYRPRHHWLISVSIAAAVLLTVLLYAPRLRDFFLSDDFGLLWACWRPDGLFANNGWISGDSIAVTSFFRFMPCSSLSGWIIYGFSGLNPLGWHVANLLLHLLNSLLVAIIVGRVVRSPWAALTAGALFAVHYLHVEPVVWISGRSVLLVSCFILSSIVVETRLRSRIWGTGRWIAMLLALTAFLSKEDSIILPMLLLIVPMSPLSVAEILRFRPRARSTELVELKVRLRRLWPYWVLAGVYLLTRLGAITRATQEQAYRLELGFNVIKNALFAAVANLFPADFREALEAWNRWYKAGEQSAVAGFLLSHPLIILGAFVAAVFWVALLFWGNRAARRMVVFSIFAVLPVLFFRGTGERLLYLSSVGSTGAIAVMLAGWHVSFGELLGRVGRFIAPGMAVLLIVLHVIWARERQANWESAADLSRTIVDASVSLAPSLPSEARIQFVGLPDNVGGAWVFRTSIESAFRIYSGRPDVTVIRESSDPPDSLEAALQRFQWDGTSFVPAD
jgi:hypothetical protein